MEAPGFGVHPKTAQSDILTEMDSPPLLPLEMLSLSCTFSVLEVSDFHIDTCLISMNNDAY